MAGKNDAVLKFFQDLEKGLRDIKRDSGKTIVQDSKFIEKSTMNMMPKAKLARTAGEAINDARVRATMLNQGFKEPEPELSPAQEAEIEDMISEAFGEKYFDEKLGFD